MEIKKRYQVEIHKMVGKTLQLASRGSSWPQNQTCISSVSCLIGRYFFITEPGKPSSLLVPQVIGLFWDFESINLFSLWICLPFFSLIGFLDLSDLLLERPGQETESPTYSLDSLDCSPIINPCVSSVNWVPTPTHHAPTLVRCLRGQFANILKFLCQCSWERFVCN